MTLQCIISLLHENSLSNVPQTTDTWHTMLAAFVHRHVLQGLIPCAFFSAVLHMTSTALFCTGILATAVHGRMCSAGFVAFQVQVHVHVRICGVQQCTRFLMLASFAAQAAQMHKSTYHHSMTAHASRISLPCVQATAVEAAMLSFSWRTRLAAAAAVRAAAAAACRGGAAGTSGGDRWLRPPGLQEVSPRCLAAVSAAVGRLRRGNPPKGAGS